MNENLKFGTNAFRNEASLRVEEQISKIKADAKESDNRFLAGIFDKFWNGMLETTQRDEELNISLQIKQANGHKLIKEIKLAQVQDLNRDDQLWEGTIVNNGINEATIIITKPGPDGTLASTQVLVSPFAYITKAGDTAYKLKPEALILPFNPNRNAFIRGKQTIL